MESFGIDLGTATFLQTTFLVPSANLPAGSNHSILKIIFPTPPDNPNTEIEVLDVLDLRFEDIDSVFDMDVSPTQLLMAGVWRITQRKGLDIKW